MISNAAKINILNDTKICDILLIFIIHKNFNLKKKSIVLKKHISLEEDYKIFTSLYFKILNAFYIYKTYLTYHFF